MRKSPENQDDDTSIPKIHERFKKLVETTQLLIKTFLTIPEVGDGLKALEEDDKKGRNSNNDLKKKKEKLPILTQKKTKK